MTSNLSLNHVGITLIPANFNLTELKKNREKILFTLPCCVKPLNCPVGRFTGECEESCSKCGMASLIKELRKLGISYRILITHDEIPKIFAEGRGKYRYLVGLGCDAVISKYKNPPHEASGFFGVAIELLGDTCKTKNEREQADKGNKQGQTYINKKAVKLIMRFLK